MKRYAIDIEAGGAVQSIDGQFYECDDVDDERNRLRSALEATLRVWSVLLDVDISAVEEMLSEALTSDAAKGKQISEPVDNQGQGGKMPRSCGECGHYFHCHTKPVANAYGSLECNRVRLSKGDSDG